MMTKTEMKKFRKTAYPYGRNIKEGSIIFHNIAVDGMTPAAEVIKYLTSCKDNGVLTRKEKREVNKVMHKKARGKPGRLQPTTVIRWQTVRLPEIRKEYDSLKKWKNKYKYMYELEIPTDNTKLGKQWGYVSFEPGWECSAFGCVCHKICYARKMEAGPNGKGTIHRIWRQQDQIIQLPTLQLAEDFADFIIKGKNGIRFCDTGGIPSQAILDKVSDAIDLAANILLDHNINPSGRFYIYTTRYDLDWSNISKWLVINASNEVMYETVERSNFFKEYHEGDEYEDEERLFCSCNCAMCDYCSTEHGEMIDRPDH